MTFLASLAGERLFFEGDHSIGVGGDMQNAARPRSRRRRWLTRDGRHHRRPVGELARAARRAGDRDRQDRDAVRLADFGRAVEAKLHELYERTWGLLEENRAEVLGVAHGLEIHKTLTGDDIAAIVDGTAGPTVDGRPYHDPGSGRCSRTTTPPPCGRTRRTAVSTRSIPVPLPPPPVDARAGSRADVRPVRDEEPPPVGPDRVRRDGRRYPVAMRLYDSLTREVRELVPHEPGHVTIYSCGPTVYRYAHLGNYRTFMLGDLIRRALRYEGLRVTQIMNITDVGHMTDESSAEAVDKMQLAMEDEGLAPLEIAEKYTRGGPRRRRRGRASAPADGYPKATEHIEDMLALTEELIDRGHAYVVDTGSVYYDVTTFPGLRATLGQHARQAPRGAPRPRDRPSQAARGRLRAVEGRRSGPADEVALPVGRGVPRVARGVLRDVDALPRGAHRHPHGRHRPAVPAPRGRDRPVRRRRRPPGRRDLGPRGPPAPHRPEDLEVGGQRDPSPASSSSAAWTRCRSGGSASRPSTAARWTSPGRRWRRRTRG